MKKRTRSLIIWCIAVALVGGLFALSACGSAPTASDQSSSTSPETFVNAKSLAEIKLPAQWESKYPDQVRTFNADTTPLVPVQSYLDIYPFLNTIYVGNAFSKSYDTPRPHLDALQDAKDSGRISESSNAVCYACKSAQYTIGEQTGQKLATASFASQVHTITQGITCYDCHKNNPGSGSASGSTANGYLGAIRAAFSTAFAREIKAGQMAPSNAACGQCHNEYYFDPATKEVSMPPEMTDPFAIFDYYNSIKYTDYVNPNTGANMLKAQHPEYDMCANDTSMHATAGLTCADCHMEKLPSGATSHKLTGPLFSAEIRKDKCLSCHKGDDAALVALIKSTQAGLEAKITSNGNALADFTNKLAAANKSGKYSAAQLDPIRAQIREAQWFLDWVLVENSKGVHNPAEANKCLDHSLEVTNAGVAALGKL